MFVPPTILGKQKTRSTCTHSTRTFCLPRSRLEMNPRSQTASGPKSANGHENFAPTGSMCRCPSRAQKPTQHVSSCHLSVEYIISPPYSQKQGRAISVQGPLRDSRDWQILGPQPLSTQELCHNAALRNQDLSTEVTPLTFGSSPNWPNCTSFNKLRAVLMISLHFFGVSSTFPARKRQQAPVT